ncbi:MAG: hypothetical protein ACQESO_04395 [Bacillota bacterium]
MDTNNSYGSEFDCPAVYEITVRGKIDSACLYSIEELALIYQTQVDGSVCSILTGLLIDQAALNGVLNLIGQLQLTIVSVLKVGDCL